VNPRPPEALVDVTDRPPPPERVLPAAPVLRARATNASAGGDDVARSVWILGQRNRLTVRGGRDARVAAIAAAQRGRVARGQLLAAGLRSGQVSRLLATDRLFALHAGVYAVGHPGPVPLGAETAALLAARDGGLLDHVTAARLWGAHELPDDGLVHVLVDSRWARAPHGVRIHRTRSWPAVERRLRNRLPVVSPARTLLSLATDLDAREVARAHDALVVAGVMRPREVQELLRRTRGHPGHSALRAIVADASAGITRSVAEQRLLSLIRAADLPAPLVNRRLLGYEVDVHWPAARLVVEVDGYRFHGTRAAFERERVRDGRLHAAGFLVIRVTWRQLEREPLAVIARIAAALATRTGGVR
jgi:very-short-patch-repair endonuclease